MKGEREDDGRNWLCYLYEKDHFVIDGTLNELASIIIYHIAID